jgi:hypothetical protein
MGPVERVALREAFRQVAADCIQRRHPHGMWLVGKQPEQMSDATLQEAVRRLRAWLAEQPPLEIHPDSWLARHGG